MSSFDYDLIVIGGGGAGITAAVFSSGLGKKTAMLDKGKFGGECTWSGCVPSKALLHSAKASHVIENAGKYGLSYKKKPLVNYEKVMKSAQNIVKSVYSHETPEHFKEMGVTAIENADIKFLDRHTVEVNGKKMTSRYFILTTGSSPFIPPVTGLDRADYYTNENIFKLKKIPGSMIIMGGGPIGIELASAFNRLNVKVTVIEMAPVILFREDPEVAEILHGILEKEGVTLLTGAKLIEVKGKKKIDILYEKEGRKKKLQADMILIAAGRKANVEGLDLEKAGVAYDSKGVEADKYMRTTAENIYAAGDVAGPYQFSHMANYQAIVAMTNAFIPLKTKTNYDNVPWCTFTDPELARSGMTESEARNKHGDSIKVFRSYYSRIDRGITDRSENGLLKVVCSKKRKILGIHIVGDRAGELMQELHLARSLGVPLHKLNSVIHAYPLYSDLIKSVARQAYIDKIQNNVAIKIIKSLRSK
jgi:pyruvate/2-oxoglutarate dehydrogenase complex dihydrolipoamide dehydrogenase (E3) component